MKTKLGRWQKVELREAWITEDRDFTPWLAEEENIELLGKTIGIDLVVEKVEEEVGPFRADILCKDELNDNMVLIENQLERTDHKHLGQLLTYAAGTKAVSIVWIAAKFTNEHRAAIDWLNSITDENFNFFGLEIELYRIGDSPIAPNFKVICQPNDWSKSISAATRTISNEKFSQTKLKQLSFWTELAKNIKKSDSKFKPRKPRPQHWTTIAIGRTNFQLSCTINTQSNTLSAQLYIHKNKSAFKHFESEKDKIENEFGEELSWELLPEKVASRIAIYRPDSNLDDEDKWQVLIDWLITKLDKLNKIFSSRIKNLEIRDIEDIDS